MTTVRRSAAALAVSAVLGVAIASAAAPSAAADTTPSPSAVLPAGLFGSGDPTYDGVWRQSLALLAQDTAGEKPAGQAVQWLTGQQCDNGGFTSYRADTKSPCAAKVPLDSNATAAAVQALAATGGHDKAVEKSVTWLKSVQNPDGGWGYNPGGASDANSTSIVIGALAAAGEKPGEVTAKGGKSPYDALLTFARPCGGKDGGAFVYQPGQPGLVADSTAAAVVGAHGEGLVVKAPGTSDTAVPACGPAKTIEGAAGNGAAHLVTALAKTGHLEAPPMPGSDDPAAKPDFGTTADAVVALAAQGLGEQTKKPLAWLEKESARWAKESGPAAYAQLIFAAHAGGADPRDFGGRNLVTSLNALGPEPEKKAEKSSGSDDSDSGKWWFYGALFAACVGVGVLFSGRRKSQR
ncbi:prenyltransferase/squalene oxidase repeat-containing protein [Streptomyces sp. CAU 1734]|uniref:prenyltransferase/squalene oxidase repeat-containing protein n=1 Tax=Streptomyces sp. CAU 1734 TaxID=3140360 RepID=UPI0032603888